MQTPVSHSNSELVLEFSCYSDWLKRHFQILQERKSNSSQTTQIKIFQKQLQVLLSLSTNWALFDSFLFHMSLTFPILFGATILNARVLEFINKNHNTVTAYFSTRSVALPDSYAARSTVYHSLLWDEGAPSNYKTNGMQLHSPHPHPVCFQPPGRSYFSCR